MKLANRMIAELRQGRAPLAARLDAIDLVIENLKHVYGETDKPVAKRHVKVHSPVRAKAVKSSAGGRSSEAIDRRDLVLAIIAKSEVGVTIADIRKQTPKMDAKARGNALQRLKEIGRIRRVGNSYIQANAQ